MNFICMVGRVKSLPEVRETPSGNKVATLEVEVERNFPNSEGVFESDVFSATLWRGLAESCNDICAVNSIVSLKGRLQARSFETKEGNTFSNNEIIVEKLSFVGK